MKFLTAKTLAQQSIITTRMAKREELENGMALLKEMCGLIGQMIYAAQLKSLLKSLPVFKSFEKSVTKIDIIDLLDDDDEDHDAPNKNSKPMTMHAANISCTEEDLTSISVYGRFIQECLPFEDKDFDDGDDNVTSPAAFVGDAQETSEHFTLQLKRKSYYGYMSLINTCTWIISSTYRFKFQPLKSPDFVSDAGVVVERGKVTAKLDMEEAGQSTLFHAARCRRNLNPSLIAPSTMIYCSSSFAQCSLYSL
jgi:hypothetical protein